MAEADPSLAGPPLFATDEEDSSQTSGLNTSTHGESSTTIGDGTNGDEGSHSGSSGDAPLAQKETRAVNRSKLLVYFVLLLAATAMGTLTYVFVSNQQEKDFETDVSSSLERKHSLFLWSFLDARTYNL